MGASGEVDSVLCGGGLGGHDFIGGAQCHQD